MFWQLALLVGQMYLGIVTQPRPHKTTFAEFLDQNKGDETRPIPYIRGKWKTSPQRIWLNDYSTRAVERDSHWTDYLFFGIGPAALLDFITVAYTYHVGQVLALTWGPINRVSQVYVDDLPCMVPPAADNAGGSLLLDFPTAFGGDQPPGQGGIYGICDVLPGDYTQPVNPYLTRIEGDVPALRGVAALVVRGRTGLDNYGYFAAAGVGGAPSLREWKVEVMAWPDNFGTGLHRLPDDSYNRLDVLYEWTTKPDYGAEYPVQNIHLPSWLDAQARLYSEGNGFSGEINTGGNVNEVVGELKGSIDAEMYEHPADGLKIKLIRKDYSIPSLMTFDESNVDSVEEYSPGDYADSYNKVILNYVNAENNYTPRPAVYEDIANYHIQRRVATREVQYPGVASAPLAQQLVTRDGRMLGQPWPPLDIRVKEIGRNHWPGDVFIFEWPHPLLSKIFRVASRTPSLSYDGERNFRLVSTEDQYSTGLAAFGAPSGSSHLNPAGVMTTAPPSAVWDTATYPPSGLIKGSIASANPATAAAVDELTKAIVGGIIFTTHSPGQYARLYVTVPGGVQTLTPVFLVPDEDEKASFAWPAVVNGTYQFCVQTFSHTGVTNGILVCATMGITGVSPSPSESPSVSASVSPSVSPSGSASPSVGASPSASGSPSASLSLSASLSPSTSPSSSASPSPSGTDPYISNVVLLAHMNGVDASTTFIDERGHILTAVNQAQIDTAQSKFGGASGLFDGTDYVSTPDSGDWYFGAGLWTLEGWFRWDSDQAAFQYLIGQWNPPNSGSLRSWTIVRDGVNAPYFLQLRLSANGSTITIKISANWSPTPGIWHHIAADWDGATYRLYVDGVVVGSSTGAISLFDSTGILAIASGFIGSVDDVRITKGVARYVGAFTPPTNQFPDS